MRDNLKLVARPKEVLQTRMDNGLDWRTARESEEISSEDRPLLANRQSGGIVYFLGAENGLVKIGFASNFVERLGKLVCGSPVPLIPLASVSGGRPEEREYHQRFAKWRKHGEWFFLTDELEEEIDRINSEQSRTYKPHRFRRCALPLTLTREAFPW